MQVTGVDSRNRNDSCSFYMLHRQNVRSVNRLKTNVIECPSCNDVALTILYNFGSVPLAKYILFVEQLNSANLVDTRLLRCEICGLVQVDPIVGYKYLFTYY